ncbi:topoisomerase [Staphylococcus saprophyticus]|uniref:topoisomerase n=1 Tax=Staphylococcus saprophyticus TaxID=29385 RepID=UPI0022EA4141|nr:topoisomerase [Staphylococcus saprophyticus]MDW3988266.1 topoisomerase [Staphylococcus saprophyticus]MDW4094944.1 topoisomerase [Staphylococcus saprophyticus]
MKKEQIENYINHNKEHVLNKVSKTWGRQVNMASFNGIIGSKNFTFDVNPVDYTDVSNYVEAWLENFDTIYQKEKNIPYEKSSHKLHKLLEDSEIRKFIIVYLARIYFNKK